MSLNNLVEYRFVPYRSIWTLPEHEKSRILEISTILQKEYCAKIEISNLVEAYIFFKNSGWIWDANYYAKSIFNSSCVLNKRKQLC